MKFLNNSFPNTLRQLSVMAILLCALVLTGCVISYANTKPAISNQPTLLQKQSSPQWKNLFQAAGQPSALGRQSIERPDQFMNSIGLETFRRSVNSRPFVFGSAEPIPNPLSLLMNSTIFTFPSSPTIPASHYATISSKPTLITAQLFSDANQPRSLKISDVLPERNLKILPTDRRRALSKLLSAASEIGRTLEVSNKPESSWRELLQRSTAEQHRFAKNLTENWCASESRTKLFKDWENSNPENLPPNFTSQKSARLFQKSRSPQSRSS